MNIGATTFMGYAYTNTNTKTTTSKQRDTNNGTTFPTQTKKEYKNVVKEFMQRHPDCAAHVNKQVEAGKRHIRNCGAENISRSDMTMDEYKAFFKDLMDRVPYDSSQKNNTEMWSITEEGWEQMKNDPDYEAWVLGYTVENRSVKFPFQTSNLCIEKFGSSIEEHRGEGIPMNTTENTKKTEKPEESWWYKRHKRMKELIKEQEEEAFSKNNVQKCVHCAKQLTLSYYK